MESNVVPSRTGDLPWAPGSPWQGKALALGPCSDRSPGCLVPGDGAAGRGHQAFGRGRVVGHVGRFSEEAHRT